jgi:hypothetical protein
MIIKFRYFDYSELAAVSLVEPVEDQKNSLTVSLLEVR